MRNLVVLLAFLSSLALTAIVAFFAILVLAGPHGGVLPASLHSATLVLGWIFVVAGPVLVAGWVWHHQSRSHTPS